MGRCASTVKREAAGGAFPQGGFADRGCKKKRAPARREPDGKNITVTSENGVTEFTFTLTIA